jgi:tetratricopeptide (TPR) repeat protein
MRTKRRFLLLFFALSACQLSPSAFAAQSTPEWCEQQWRADSADFNARSMNLSALTARYSRHEAECKGTVTYEARLAGAYAMTHQFDRALEILKPVDGASGPWQHLVDFAKLQIDFFSLLDAETVTRAQAVELRNKFEAYVRKYPDFRDAYSQLGALQAELGDHSSAIKSLEFAIRSPMNMSGAFNLLTISYTAVGRYDDALQAADRAYDMDKAVTSDPRFMYALAKSNAGVGQLEAARRTLQVIAAKKPEVRTDPEFKEAVQFVVARQKSAPPSNQPGGRDR